MVFLGHNTLVRKAVYQVPLGPVHTGRGGARKCCMQTMEHIVPNGSVHTALLATSKDLPTNLRANLLMRPV